MTRRIWTALRPPEMVLTKEADAPLQNVGRSNSMFWTTQLEGSSVGACNGFEKRLKRARALAPNKDFVAVEDGIVLLDHDLLRGTRHT